MSTRSLKEETRSWKSYIWYVRLPRPVLHISLKLGEGIHGTSQRKNGGFCSSSTPASLPTPRSRISANKYHFDRQLLFSSLFNNQHVPGPAKCHRTCTIVLYGIANLISSIERLRLRDERRVSVRMYSRSLPGLIDVQFRTVRRFLGVIPAATLIVM